MLTDFIKINAARVERRQNCIWAFATEGSRIPLTPNRSFVSSQRKLHLFFYETLFFYLTVINNMIIFYIVRGCPGFDGIGKSCTAGRGEGPLNWRQNNCNFRKKRRRSWWGFFRSRSTRCVSSRAGTQAALFRVAWCSFTLSGLAAHCVWSLRGTLNQNTEATLVMLLPAPDNHLA